MIIPLGLSDFSSIKEEINNYLDKNRDKYKILDNLEPSTRTMLVDLIAGYAVYNQYKFMTYRKENNLETAELPSSIYNLAFIRYGYNIARNKSPQVEIKYLGNEKICINDGFIVGNLNYNGINLDIVYFGSERHLNFGDTFVANVGIYKEIEGDFLDFDLSGLIKITIKGETYQIDNDNIVIFINNKKYSLEKDLERFIINDDMIQLSTEYKTINIYIGYEKYNLGKKVNITDTYKVKYLESPGYIENFNEITDKANLIQDFTISKILSYGMNGDDLDKVKVIAPLYHTTLRKMDNQFSHRVIAMNYPGILDIYVEKNPNKCCSVDFYYVMKKDRYTPRILTDKEVEDYIKFLSYYKYVGVTLEKENIIPAIPVYLNLHFTIRYDCNLIPNFKAVAETKLINFVFDLLDKKSFKLGKKYKESELLSEISKFSYNGMHPIKYVEIDSDDVTYENKEILLDNKHYFIFKPTFDITCYQG